MSTRTERAESLRTEIVSILDNYIEGGQLIPVTLDARDLDRASLARGIVLVSPGPRMEWPAGPAMTRVTWTLYVLQKAGSALDEWGQVDTIMDALIAAGLGMTEAEPAEVPRPEPAPNLTGYTITLTEDYLN